MTVDYAKVAAAMRAAQTRPRYTGPTVNVVTYWRPSKRHLWRVGATIINVPEPDPDKPLPCQLELHADGSETARIPYDWQVWTPPKRARTLPGLLPCLLAIGRDR